MSKRKTPNKNKKRLATDIVRRLRRHGFTAYFVGGCVRDMLMRKSAKDFDIATDAKTAQLKRIFSRNIYPIGEKFGTLLLVRDKVDFQISTFRDKKGRFASTLEDDLGARDFTINGLAYDPIKRKVIDLLHGKEDIRIKRIKAIGEAAQCFNQDPLRMIRAIRFATMLGFSIEPKTLQVIKKMAGKIKRISKERIREELISIFTSMRPAKGLQLLDKSGLLKYVLPNVEKMKAVEQPAPFHPEGDVFSHTLLTLKQLNRPSLVLVFSCLLHDVGKPDTFERAERIRFNGHDKVGARLSDKILRQLRFSNRDREDIVACVENHMRMMEAPHMREATLKRLFSRPTFETELNLHYIDCLASHRDLKVFSFLKSKYRQFQKSPLIPKPLLNGYELIKLGFTPGPIFGKIHKEMVDLQLEGKLKTKSRTKKWVKDNFLKDE